MLFHFLLNINDIHGLLLPSLFVRLTLSQNVKSRQGNYKQGALKKSKYILKNLKLFSGLNNTTDESLTLLTLVHL